MSDPDDKTATAAVTMLLALGILSVIAGASAILYGMGL